MADPRFSRRHRDRRTAEDEKEGELVVGSVAATSDQNPHTSRVIRQFSSGRHMTAAHRRGSRTFPRGMRPGSQRSPERLLQWLCDATSSPHLGRVARNFIWRRNANHPACGRPSKSAEIAAVVAVRHGCKTSPRTQTLFVGRAPEGGCVQRLSKNAQDNAELPLVVGRAVADRSGDVDRLLRLVL